MCQQTMYLRNLSRLSRLGQVNHFMQEFFRRWHEQTADCPADGVIDISQMPIIRESNARLLESMSSGTYFRQFKSNVCQLETLAWEIVEHSGVALTPPFRKPSGIGARTRVTRQAHPPRAPSGARPWSRPS